MGHVPFDRNFAASVQLILDGSAAGRPHHEVVLTIAQTPQYLIDHGFPSLPLCISAKVIDKAHFDHGITRGVLERLGEVISRPKALYRSATHAQSAVVITFELKNGCPILLPVHACKQIGRASFANMVASVYNKEASVEARWSAQGLLLWKPARK